MYTLFPMIAKRNLTN